MMWPPEPDDGDEAELQCEAWCLEEGLEIIWFAYGYMEPDEDGWYFVPNDQHEATCPWCNTVGEYGVLSTQRV